MNIFKRKSDQSNDKVEEEDQDVGEAEESEVVSYASLFADMRPRSIGRGASNLARESVEGAILAVGEVSSETTSFVRDSVIGAVQGTSQFVTITTPAVRETVIGAIRGSRRADIEVESASRDAIEGAIVGAASIGIGSAEAATAAVEGSIDIVNETRGDLDAVADATMSGVIVGVATVEGDLASAARDASRQLVTHAGQSFYISSTIASVAESAMDATIREAVSDGQKLNEELISAAARGAVEGAYKVTRSGGHEVREAVLGRIADPVTAVPTELMPHLVELHKQLDEDLPRGPGIWQLRVVIQAFRTFFQTGGIDFAASLGYFTMMSLFPLVALVIVLAAVFSDPQWIRDKLTETLVYYFPASESLLNEVIEHLFNDSVGIGLVASLGMIVGANGLFMAVTRTINRVFGIESRKMVETTRLQALVAIAIAGLFSVSIGVTAAFHTIVEYADGIIRSIGGVSTVVVVLSAVLSTVLPAILTASIFIVVYYYLPNRRVNWSDAAFGGVFAAICFEIGKHIFFWFINQVTNNSVIYGPVASFVVLLLWAYIAGLMFVFGASLSKVSGELRPGD